MSSCVSWMFLRVGSPALLVFRLQMVTTFLLSVNLLQMVTPFFPLYDMTWVMVTWLMDIRFCISKIATQKVQKAIMCTYSTIVNWLCRNHIIQSKLCKSIIPIIYWKNQGTLDLQILCSVFWSMREFLYFLTGKVITYLQYGST